MCAISMLIPSQPYQQSEYMPDTWQITQAREFVADDGVEEDEFVCRPCHDDVRNSDPYYKCEKTNKLGAL